MDICPDDICSSATHSVKMKAGQMNRRIQTREFRIADYAGALRLWRRVKGVEIAEGDDKRGVAQFLARNPGLSRVAVDGSAIVGVVLCGHDGRRGHIYHLAVDPAYQGKKLGSRLVDECIKALRQTGMKRAIILVAEDNLQGVKFWKRQGWEEIRGALAMGIDV
jgi:ribosomal protein S18 acetylase RimI-like enzyme